MSKVVAIAGLGDAPPASPLSGAMLGWLFVSSAAVGIFLGTLFINPKKRA